MPSDTSDKTSGFRRTLDNIIRYTSSVGENTRFTGNFEGGENIVVRGEVAGESDVEGAIVITETGKWIGNLAADVVVIAGEVKGNILAREKLEIYSTARVFGDLTCPTVAMEMGAIHEGHMDMKHTNLSEFTEKRLGNIDDRIMDIEN